VEVPEVFKNGFWETVHNPDANKDVCGMIAAGIQAQVNDQEVARKLTPTYPFFCKRALFIDDYYTTFNRSNVTLIHDEGGVARVHETGLETAGGHTVTDLDVIIYATGFDAGAMQFQILGRNGLDLAASFGASERNKFQITRPQTLWGVHVPDFPNMYMMIGPQSLNPLTNVTLLCEAQAKYITALVKYMRGRGVSKAEPKEHAVAEWSQLCNTSSDGKVWLQCGNWYMKTTKDDQRQGREVSSNMWFETYQAYLSFFRDGKGGSYEDLLAFS